LHIAIFTQYAIRVTQYAIRVTQYAIRNTSYAIRIKMKRLIGNYTGAEHGALIIAIGAMHGNEPSGVRALQTLFQMLEDEPLHNPTFSFKGKIIGLIGNVQAYERKVRFIEKDLNRQFLVEQIEDLKSRPPQYFEDLERIELLQTIENEINTYKPKNIIVLDLHTTSADGGIFTIVAEDEESIAVASELHAPVVKGFVQGTGGTTIHYFKTENMGVPTFALSFEAGQHDDPLSEKRAIAWLVNALRATDCVQPEDVETKHEEILRGYSDKLPKVVQLFDSHKITDSDNFKMMPNYKNFQSIKKGEKLATDNKGDIKASEDCLILMPLYQAQGQDGFFLVKEVKS
jgi:succinylglutamate desuccinylase